jgi:hypothetical protein
MQKKVESFLKDLRSSYELPLHAENVSKQGTGKRAKGWAETVLPVV